MHPARSANHPVLARIWTEGILNFFTCGYVVIVVDPFSHVAGQIVNAFYVGSEGANRGGYDVIVVVAEDNSADQVSCGAICLVAIAIGRRQVAAPRETQRCLGGHLMRGPGPLRFCR